MNNVTKLTASNFLMWSRQVSALLDGYDLSGFLDGSAVPPPPTITNEGEVTSNPDYLLWKRQDRLIYSGLLGAITVSIQPFLSTATTSAQIWETLSSTYAKPSRGHIQQLRQQIKSWTKGTMSIDDYFQGFKTWFDQVALLGKPYDIEDQIEFLLEGLPEDYKPVKDQIEGRESPPSLTEIHEKLLNHETKLLSKTTSSSPKPQWQRFFRSLPMLPITAAPRTTIPMRRRPAMASPATTTLVLTRPGNNSSSVRAMINLRVAIRVVVNCVASMDTLHVGAISFRAQLPPTTRAPRPRHRRGNLVLIWPWLNRIIQETGSWTAARHTT